MSLEKVVLMNRETPGIMRGYPYTLYLDDPVLPHTDASLSRCPLSACKSHQSHSLKTLFDEFEQEFIEIRLFPLHKFYSDFIIPHFVNYMHS